MGLVGWKMSKDRRFYVGAFIPTILLLAIGIGWISFAVHKINDPQNYLTHADMPLRQENAVFKFVGGGIVGGFIGSTMTYLFTCLDKVKKKQHLWGIRIVIALEIVLSHFLIGGVPRSVLPRSQSALVTLWAPFRISFTAGIFIGLGVAIAILVALKLTRHNMTGRS